VVGPVAVITPLRAQELSFGIYQGHTQTNNKLLRFLTCLWVLLFHCCYAFPTVHCARIDLSRVCKGIGLAVIIRLSKLMVLYRAAQLACTFRGLVYYQLL